MVLFRQRQSLTQTANAVDGRPQLVGHNSHKPHLALLQRSQCHDDDKHEDDDEDYDPESREGRQAGYTWHTVGDTRVSESSN